MLFGMVDVASISRAQARRIALRAQGLDRPRPVGRVDRRHIRRVLDDVALLQIDSVNVVARAQYMPLFSRLGPYDTTVLDRMAYQDRELFEYWGHEASLIPVEHHPLLRWRMAGDHAWGGPRRVASEHPDLVARLEAEVLEHGPVSAGDLEAGGTRKGPWWGWSDTKRALEHLFHSGRIAAIRDERFQRLYCSPAHAVPAEILARPTPDHDTAMRALLMLAARAHGVGTAKDLADVWRVRTGDARVQLQELVGDGSLQAVQVEGWRDLAYRHPDVKTPRKVEACTLVSPFDSAMWERGRVERLHDFEYRIEIYVPEAKRRFGYYVYPFLLGDTYAARVDLKADRANRRLLVRSAHAEPDLDARDTDTDEVSERLAGELRTLALWLGLDDVVVADHGDLAPALLQNFR